jgi:hypothetical protein
MSGRPGETVPAERVSPNAPRPEMAIAARFPSGGRYWAVVAGSGALALAAGASLAVLATRGVQPYGRWGYTAAAVAFVLSTAQAAPLIAFATRLVSGQWSVPLRRVAELGSLSGLVTAPVIVLLTLQLPDFAGRPSIWHGWPGSPWLWDSLAAALLALTGLAAFLAACVPDTGSAARRAR